MPETQRWLSLIGICNTLQTNPKHIQWLVKQGFLEYIPDRSNKNQGSRYLDPTPQYADRLRLAEVIYRRRFPLPADIDIDSKAIFTSAELAVLMGWTPNYTDKFLFTHKPPCVKIGGGKTGGLRLFSAKTIRELIWRRKGRKVSAQKSPFLISELLEFFQKRMADDDVPTDAQFADDERLQKKLTRLLKMPSPQREEALREFLAKVELAKEISKRSL